MLHATDAAMSENPQPIHERLPNDGTYAAAMSPLQRRIVLTMLVGLFGFIATLPLAYGRFAHLEWLWLPLWTGFVVSGQICLLAVWAAWSGKSRAVRWSQALGLAACLGLAVAWASQGYSGLRPSGLEAVVVGITILFLLAALLAIVRRRYGWRIVAPCDTASFGSSESQFSLRELLAWTAGTAVVLAVARWTLPAGSTSSADWSKVVVLLVTTAVWGLRFLPLVVPCVGCTLGQSHRRRFAVWAMVMAVLAFALAIVLGTVLEWLFSSMPVSMADIAWRLAWKSVPEEIGLLIAIFGSLGVLRVCGYRLARGETQRTAPILGSDGRSGSRTAFPYLVGAIALLALLLCWPAWHIELGRQQACADQIAAERFKRLGASAVVYQGRLVWFGSLPNQPGSEAALELLAEYGDRADLNYLDLSGWHLTDNQVKCLSGLKHLRHLNLAGTGISDAGLAHLGRLSQLKNLDLADTKITDEGAKTLERFPNLQGLRLRGTRVSGDGFMSFRSLRELRYLNLSDTTVDDQALKALKPCSKLAFLYVDNTRVTDSGVAQLQDVKNLSRVSFANTQVTDRAKAELIRAIPSCTILSSCPESPPPAAQ